MGHKFLRKLFSFFLSFLLLFQGSSPHLVAFAQEVADSTPSAEIVVESTSTPTPEPTPELTPEPTSTPIPTIEPTLTPTPGPTSEPIPAPGPEPAPLIETSASEAWTANDNGGYTTSGNVMVGVTYSAPQDSKVSVTFKTLPLESGKLTIKEIKLNAQQQADIGAFSDIAYDITSDMTDGTFTYDLTLPVPETAKGKTIEVKSGETVDEVTTNAEVIDEPKEVKSETITITGLDHFTIFVISGTITNPGPDTYVGEPFDETSSQVIINEFLFDPSSGNEWIELFNKTSVDINLENWQLVDGNGDLDDLTLPGILPANGILVFEKSGGDGWLNNAGSESITLKDDDTQTQDIVSYKGSSFFNGQNIGDVAEDQSVCRTSDGGDTWQACPSSTKGWFNDAETFDCVNPPSGAPTLTSIASCLEDQELSTNIGTIDNPSATLDTEAGGALYFENSEGKIVFEKTLNLSDQNTVDILQGLGMAMEMSAGHIKFDSETADAMTATGAKIYMYEIFGYDSAPEIFVKDDNGVILGTTSDSSADDDINIDSINYSPDLGELSFTAFHFTQFDLPAAPNAPVLHEVSSPTNDTTPTLSWDDVSATPEVTYYEIEIYDSN